MAASKLHSDRLVALEAHQAELRAAEQEAQDRHAAHITSIDPLKAKYAHHKVRHSHIAPMPNGLLVPSSQSAGRYTRRVSAISICCAPEIYVYSWRMASQKRFSEPGCSFRIFARAG